MSAESRTRARPQHFLTPRKAELRKFLNTRPRLKDGWPVDPRDSEKRFEAAFDLYDISPDLPDTARWITLATYLMGEHFKGCKGIERQPGGSPKVPDDAYMELARSFKEWCATKVGKQLALAEDYLDDRGNEIKLAHEKISKPRSLLKAVRHGNVLIKKLSP